MCRCECSSRRLHLRGKTPGSAIERAEIERFAERISEGDIVLLNTGNEPAKAEPPHKTMLGNGKVILEELYSPDEVMDGKKRLFVGALR